jgi:hypothetical protein
LRSARRHGIIIVFLGMSSGAGRVGETSRIPAGRAVSVAEMEAADQKHAVRVLTLAPDNVAVSIDNVSRQIRGLNTNYGVWRTVDHLNVNNQAVTLRVTWNRI